MPNSTRQAIFQLTHVQRATLPDPELNQGCGSCPQGTQQISDHADDDDSNASRFGSEGRGLAEMWVHPGSNLIQLTFLFKTLAYEQLSCEFTHLPTSSIQP